jgi:hypothetical protein
MIKGADYKTLMFYLDGKNGYQLGKLNFKKSLGCELHYKYPFGRSFKLSYLTLNNEIHHKEFTVKQIGSTSTGSRVRSFFSEAPRQRSYIRGQEVNNIMLTTESITTIDPKLLRR